MQRRKKQLLGLVGLVLVAIVMAIACALPTPGAAASSTSVPIRVEVVTQGPLPTVSIASLHDDDIEVNKTFNVTIEYAKATKLMVYIKNLGPTAMTLADVNPGPQDGEIAVSLAGSDCASITYSEENQTCTVEYTLPGNLAGANGVSFATRAVAVNGTAGDSSSESIVAFTYRAAKFDGDATYESGTNNPIIHIVMGSDVKSGELIVVDADGKPVFGNLEDGEEGKYEAIKFTGYNSTNNGKVDITLPFKGHDIANGEYRVILMAYDNEDGEGDDALIALAGPLSVNYTKGGSVNPGGPTTPTDPDDPNNPSGPEDPDNPDVPGTGLNLFGGLNISSADYILTGLIAFGMVTMFAIFLIVRRSKR